MVRSGENADRSAERTPSYWAVLAAALVVSFVPGIARAQSNSATAAPPTSSTAIATDRAIANPAAQAEDRVLLEADTVDQDQVAHTVTAEGNVEVRYQDRTMRADKIVYNMQTGVVHAIGDVEIVSADGSAEYADEVEVDEALNVGVATEFRARFGHNGTLAARSVFRRSEDSNELHNVIYTSCPVCETGHKPPTWSLRARRAVQDRTKRIISYRDAIFEVAGVPLLYLPYFANPDPSAGRTSGFLPPDFGQNRRLGAFYDQPYFWAISPSQDLTVSARVHSQVNPLYGIDYRKRFFSGDLRIQGTITQEQDFDGDGNTFGDDTTRSSIFAHGQFRISDYWKWGFGAERTSDDLYLRRYDLRGTGERRGPFVGTNTRLISQLYATGQDDTSYASIAAVSFQGLLATDTPALLPNILPTGEYEKVLYDPVLNGQLRLDASTAVLQRSVGEDTARGTVSATWRVDKVIGPGLVFSPFAQARGDVYRNETTTNNYDTFGRGLGMAGAQVSWPFMRPGEKFDLIVEPVVMGAWASDEVDDTRIVNEDSQGFELDDSDLFRPNAAPNYDLWEPGGRLSAGVRATARAPTGQSASLIFGRRWRSEAAPGFTVQNNLEGRASDWVGAIQTDLGRSFASDVRFRFDDQDLSLQRIDAGVRGAYGRFTANARYFQINQVLAPGNPSEELSAGLGVELSRGWRAEFGLRRDLDSDINLSQDIRAIYEDDCTFLEIAYTRSETLDRTLGPSEGLQIRVGLRSLGVVGGS